MARVRAVESFSGLLACMGAAQEADFDDETAERMAAEGYPVEIVDDAEAKPSGRKKAAGPGPDAGDGGEGDGDDGGGAAGPGPDAGA